MLRWVEGCALVTCEGHSRSAARLLTEQLQLPGERDTGAAAVLKEHLAALNLAVSSRAQSRCNSPATAIQVMGTTPAIAMRRTAMSCASALTPPDASVTA